ncbi:MAG: LacI family DNA-binding transcriptional regulator, partial [Agrococcus sp.]
MASTLADVAAHAGVSVQTVSNALNNPDLLKRSTLDRVLAAVDDLGYAPNLQARRLRQR